MIYGEFDSNGLPTAFYSDALHASIPSLAVPLTEEDWREFINNSGARRWDGVKPVPLAPPPVDLPAYAAEAHKTARDGGVSLAGLRIKTDAESRALIAGAYALSQDDPHTVIDFKLDTGWIVLPAPAIQALALGVGRWVQACYTAYRQVSLGIADSNITTTAQIDAAFLAIAAPG